MHKDVRREPVRTEAREKKTKDAAEGRKPESKPTESGLTREELRALVLEMIG